MFTPNIMNISIWVLAGILVLIVIVLLILRALGIDVMKNSYQSKKKDVGRVSKDMQQIVLSLGSIHDINAGYNILVRNKFAKTGYGLMPAVAVRNGNIFLITNRIKVDKYDIVFDNEKKVMVNKKGKLVQDTDFLYKWYKDSIKYLKNISGSMKVQLVVPVLGNIDRVENKSGLTLVSANDLGEYIINSPGEGDAFLEKQFLEKLERDNMFKKSGALDKKRAERLMR